MLEPPIPPDEEEFPEPASPPCPPIFKSPFEPTPPLPPTFDPGAAPPVAEIVVIVCVPDATEDVLPALNAAPPAPLVIAKVFPGVRPVSHLIAAPPPPPPLPVAPEQQPKFASLPPAPPPTTVTLTRVIPVGIVKVPLPVKTCPFPPAVDTGAAAEVQVVPLEVRTFPLVLGATNLGADVPLPKITFSAVKVVKAVPPEAMGSGLVRVADVPTTAPIVAVVMLAVAVVKAPEIFADVAVIAPKDDA